MGLLETIRAAVAAPELISADADKPGAVEPIPTHIQETEAMTTGNPAPGAAVNAGLSEADISAAVQAALAEGASNATKRIGTILGADGIKGDGGRMAAALDLAAQSPDMAAEAVVGFVTGNVVAGKTAGISAYEQERLSAAAGLTTPGGKTTADQVKAGWAKAFKAG